MAKWWYNATPARYISKALSTAKWCQAKQDRPDVSWVSCSHPAAREWMEDNL